LQRIIKKDEGTVPQVLAYVLIILLLPLFLFEGYVLMETSEQVEVEDIYVENYEGEIDEETDNITKIEMDLKIDIKNSADRDLEIEKLEYELMIKPEDKTLEKIEFDEGEVEDKTIYGDDITTISMPVENEDEQEIETIKQYILEEEGEVDAVAEVHVPLLQTYIDLPLTTVSEKLEESFEYEPILEDYGVYEDEVNLERSEDKDEEHHVLRVPYEIETNDNKFLSGEVEVFTVMESTDGVITSSDSTLFDIGDDVEGDFLFLLDKDDTEELLRGNQTIEFYSDIVFEDDLSFYREHEDIESPAVLEDFEIEEDNSTLEEAEDEEESDHILKTPYEMITNENEFVEGDIEIDIIMESVEAGITSSDEIRLEIGDDREGYLRFGLDEEETEELFTEEQTLEFSSEVTPVEEDISFNLEHQSVDCGAVLEEFEVDEDDLTLEEAKDDEASDHILKTPYEIITSEDDLVSGEVQIITTMTDGEKITSSDEIRLEIGDDSEGYLRFGLDEGDTEDLFTEEQTLEFSSEITTVEEDISFDFEHQSVTLSAVLEEFELEEDNATLEEAEEEDDHDYVLNATYEIMTNEDDLVSGEVQIITTMTDDEKITSSDEIRLEIGDDREGYLRFGLDEEDTEELFTEEQTLEFSSEVTTVEEDISFNFEHQSVDSEAMLVEYEIEGDDAELDLDKKQLEIPYQLETRETAFIEEGGNVLITTIITSEDGSINCRTTYEIEIGETEEGILIFGLDDDEVEELREEEKTLQFISEVERDHISFEYEHEEEGEWDPD